MNDPQPTHRPVDPVEEPLAIVPVWDMPTRLFHWVLVVLVVINVATGKIGGLRLMEIHMMSGYAILTLVLFRLAWGFVGGRHARFANFLTGARAVAAHFKDFFAGRPARHLGHNPLGGWSVVVILALLLLQAGTGLFANDDILSEGPLARKVGKRASDLLTYVHYLSSNALIAILCLHVAAVFVYLAKGENLIRPMITGVKRGPYGDPDDRRAVGSMGLALVLLALAVAAVWAIVNVTW
jgi:cytochrome b